MPRCGWSFRRWPVEWRFSPRLLIEASWEVVENTPMVIDRYRETTAALGYSGDSVINSVSDILMMCVGFLAARKLPLWASIVLLILLELVPLFVIRDNLTLNILEPACAQCGRPGVAGPLIRLQ